MCSIFDPRLCAGRVLDRERETSVYGQQLLLTVFCALHLVFSSPALRRSFASALASALPLRTDMLRGVSGDPSRIGLKDALIVHLG